MASTLQRESLAALYRYAFSAPPAPGACFALLDTDEQQKAMLKPVTFCWFTPKQILWKKQTVQKNKNDRSRTGLKIVPVFVPDVPTAQTLYRPIIKTPTI